MATTWRQDAFRISNDDGSETGASYQAALNVNGSRMVGQNFRLRFLVSEQGTTAAALTATLYYQKNGTGGYIAVTGSSSVARASLSANFVDDAATTRTSNPRALGAGTFVAGKMDESTGACTATGSIVRYSETEIEFCIQLQAADLVSGNYVDFRVYNSTTALGTYSNTARITAGVALTGTGAESAVKAALAGTGAERFSATGALSDKHPSLSGAGAEVFTATGAESAKAPTFAGSGTVEAPAGVTGEGAWTARAAALSGTGQETSSGTLAILARASALAGTGFETVSGTASVSPTHPALGASGLETVSGTAAVAIRPSELEATGGETCIAAGAFSAPPARLTSTGAESSSGAAGVTVRPCATDGAGTERYSSTTAVSALHPTLTGGGTVLFAGPFTGTAEFTTSPVRFAGNGWLSGLDIDATGAWSASPCQINAAGCVVRVRRLYGRGGIFRRTRSR